MSDETPIENLDPDTLHPDLARVIFASEWDDTIDFYRAVATAAGLSHEDFLVMLQEDKAILMEHVPLPRPMTVERSKPYVQISDMLTLARLARYCFEHIDDLGFDLGSSKG